MGGTGHSYLLVSNINGSTFKNREDGLPGGCNEQYGMHIEHQKYRKTVLSRMYNCRTYCDRMIRISNMNNP
jgi:hypothetical protein